LIEKYGLGHYNERSNSVSFSLAIGKEVKVRYLDTMTKRLFALAMLVAFVGGCGSGSNLNLAPVSGTVTYRGQPLTHGQVVFLPQGDTKGPQAVGEIGSDGKYAMMTANKSGAAVGTHKVTVICRRKVSEEEARNLVIGNLLTPGKYANEVQTPLEITVEPGGQTYDITLSD